MGEARRKAERAESEPSAFTRRGVVLALAGGALALPLGLWWARGGSTVSPSPTPAGPPERRALEALLDVLLPGGEGMPSHRETRIAEHLWRVALKNQAMRNKLAEGASLLDAEAKAKGHDPTFANLAAPERTTIVESLRKKSPADAGHAYYRFLRDQAMRLHYTHSAARAPLGFSRAPQPQGFPNYARAPRG